MDVVVGIGVAVLLIGALLGMALAGADKQERERLRKLEEEKAEEEARLAPKREALKRLRVKAAGEESFLGVEYQERYAHEHYSQVLGKEWAEELEEDAKWEADPDFEQLVRELNGQRMRQVWRARRAVRAFAGGLTRGERAAWEAKWKRLFKEAADRGVDVDELRIMKAHEQTRESEAETERRLETLKGRFEVTVVNCVLVGERTVSADTEKELQRVMVMSEIKDKDEDPETWRMVQAVLRNVEEREPEEVLVEIEDRDIKVGVVAIGAFVRNLAGSVLQGKTEEFAALKMRERKMLGVVRECFESDEEMVVVCTGLEEDIFGRVDKCLDKARKHWGEKYEGSIVEEKVGKKLEGWAEEYRGRLWKQRTPEDFRRIMGVEEDDGGWLYAVHGGTGAPVPLGCGAGSRVPQGT